MAKKLTEKDFAELRKKINDVIYIREAVKNIADRIIENDISLEEIKKCTKCGKYKNRSEFSRCRENKDGLYNKCKECLHKKYMESKKLKKRAVRKK
jgi:NAD-dependent SIR2 family protein deacetylase